MARSNGELEEIESLTTHALMEPSMERLRHAFANQSPSIRGVEGSGNPLTVLHSLSHLLI